MPEMEKIHKILEDLEAKHDVKIVYAVEAGSRAWGLDSTDSDFDIRFIYVNRKSQNYVSLKPIKETLDGFSEDRVYDWQGWDITKALRLIHAMNPSIVEWLYSPIVYKNDSNDFPEHAKKLVEEQKRISPLLHHYKSMAKSNYKVHIENKPKVNIKKYLYVIRPAGMVVWLLKCKSNDQKSAVSFIEVDFNNVLDEIRPHMNNECYENIVRIIEVKKKLKEIDEEQPIKCIDDWIQSILAISDFGIKETRDAHNMDNYDRVLHSFLNIKFNDQLE